jgi:hypothetical protein
MTSSGCARAKKRQAQPATWRGGNGACEDAYAAHIGPLHLEVNRCFVLDHDDAFISIRIPTPWGKLHLGYVVCLGEDEIRQPGFYVHLWKPLPKVVYGQGKDSPDNPIPF